MTTCLHPSYKRILDEYTHEWKTICYPCGKCWNCIHSFRESWRIRLYETMLASRLSPVKGFIYDTLTLSNDAMPSVSIADYFTGEIDIDVKGLHDKDLMRIVDHYQGRVPVLYKETVSRWLKIGRELYFQHYGKRCELKFFGALEYGPLWGRPHVHIAVFGVNRADWVRFWAKRWRRSMGFTKTKFVDLSQAGSYAMQHCSRISTYISKYLMKGSLESPLVKYGIAPEPWRVCSHGIGEELISYDLQHRFDWLKKDIKYWMSNRIPFNSNSNSRAYIDAEGYVKEFYSRLLPTEVESLKTYVKDGYKSALPRYYRDRLLCTHKKGLGGKTIQIALSENAFNDCFEEVLQHASECCYFPRFRGDIEGLRKFLEHDLRAFNFAYHKYFAFKRIQNMGKAKWHRLSSLNFKNRLRAKLSSGDLGLLL